MSASGCTDDQWRWLANSLTADKLRELLPETEDLTISVTCCRTCERSTSSSRTSSDAESPIRRASTPKPRVWANGCAAATSTSRRTCCEHLDDTQRRQLRDSVRHFAEREIVPNIDEWERSGELPRSCTAGPPRPDYWVPTCRDRWAAAVTRPIPLTISEALHEAGTPGGVYASLFTCGISVPHMAASGDERLIEIRSPHLRGDLIGSLAITEPGGGSDVGHPGRRRPGMATNTSSTAPRPITSGVRADYVVTAVRTGGPGAAGVSLLVVEKGTQDSRYPANSTRWAGALPIPPNWPTPTSGCLPTLWVRRIPASPRSHPPSFRNGSALPHKRIRAHNAA